MFCEKCGNQLIAGTKFCSRCGANFEQLTQPAASQNLPQNQQQYTPPPVQQQYNPPPVQHQPMGQQYAPPPMQQPVGQQYAPPPMQQQYIQPPAGQPVGQYPQYPMQAQSVKKSKTPIFIALGIAAAGIIIALFIVVFGILGQRNSNQGDIIGSEAGSASPANNDILTPAQVFESNIDAVFQIFLYIDDYHVGWGSGFFISSSGVAVTNHHVLDGMNRAVAVLYDGSSYEITGYYSYDTGNDLAVIQVDGKGKSFQPVTIGKTDDINVGDRVYAIGGPGGDPLTLTEGIISRFANETINYDNYSVAGMLQTTAFIYGGNSGGPLFNDKGHVIGINSAGRIDRESTQWAVPVDRLVNPASGASISSLPVGGLLPSHFTGQIFYFERFPNIPDFLSVSSNAYLILGGTAADVGFDLFLDIDSAGIFNFNYVYYYSLDGWYFVDDTDLYDDVLMEHGFTFQGVESTSDDDSDVTYVFLHHPQQNISLVYSYYWEYEMMFLLIGSGNAYEVLSNQDFGRYHGQQTMSATEELYNAALYAENVLLYIYWYDGAMTTFYTNNYGGWSMESRNGGTSDVEPTFSYWGGVLYIGFPTTSRIYNLFDDYSGFFGDELLAWGYEYHG